MNVPKKREVITGFGIFVWAGLLLIVCTAAIESVRSNKPVTAIGLDKMNMFYIGLENPVSISVSGYRPDQIEVKAEGVTLKGNNGHYTVNPASPGKAVIKVYVKGKKEPVHQSEYRLRPVPRPEILLGANPGPTISRGELATVNLVSAGLGSSFAYEAINYTIQAYTLIHASRKGGNPYVETVTGNRITPGMRAQFEKAKAGDMIVISEVRVSGPGGNRLINGPTLTVK